MQPGGCSRFASSLATTNGRGRSSVFGGLFAAAAAGALFVAATMTTTRDGTVAHAEELQSSPTSRKTPPQHRDLEIIASLPRAVTDEPSSDATGPLASVPFSSLARSYLVYTLCSIPAIVDHSPRLLDLLTHSSIPGVPTLTYSLVRQTFFKQFVGGESVTDCHETMTSLRRKGCGTLLAYSVEVDEHEAEDHHTSGDVAGDAKRRAAQSHVDETLRAIEDAGAFERSAAGEGIGATWVAVKVTGLTPDPEALHRASNELVRRRWFAAGNVIKVGYPGTPISQDLEVLDGKVEVVPARLSAVAAGGVLEGEEGLRRGDVETLKELAGVLREIATKARDNE